MNKMKFKHPRLLYRIWIPAHFFNEKGESIKTYGLSHLFKSNIGFFTYILEVHNFFICKITECMKNCDNAIDKYFINLILQLPISYIIFIHSNVEYWYINIKNSGTI